MAQEINILTAVVKKARQNDGNAQGWLYGQYSKAMFNICIRMTGNRADAEDVLQESFLIAFKSLHQLKVEQHFGGWLRKIVINECIRYSKKVFYWDEWEADKHDSPQDEETEWWQHVKLEHIHRQVKNLPEGCRQVFNLFVLEDYSHKQIAENLGITEGTSKSQYHRARQLLKEKIVKQLQTDGQV